MFGADTMGDRLPWAVCAPVDKISEASPLHDDDPVGHRYRLI
jgi:hypothetical protein